MKTMDGLLKKFLNAKLFNIPSKDVYIDSFSEGSVCVGVKNPLLMSELYAKKEYIKRGLSTPDNPVKDIAFIIK